MSNTGPYTKTNWEALYQAEEEKVRCLKKKIHTKDRKLKDARSALEVAPKKERPPMRTGTKNKLFAILAGMLSIAGLDLCIYFICVDLHVSLEGTIARMAAPMAIYLFALAIVTVLHLSDNNWGEGTPKKK
jgi:hypothetical protein